MMIVLRFCKYVSALLCLLALCLPLRAEEITIAAASSLKPAMAALVADFQGQHPDADIEVVYGSSGRFFSQIQRGAPYHLYFAADMDYPQQLVDKGFASGEVMTYAEGRLVLWSAVRDVSQMTLQDLTDADIRRVAIANPRHAPYGQSAEEALRAAGVWQAVAPKLVYGESITHAAQFAHTGNAEVGIIALSLVLSPPLAEGAYQLVPRHLHTPLRQGFIITAAGADSPLAEAFADYLHTDPARRTLAQFGLGTAEVTGE